MATTTQFDAITDALNAAEAATADARTAQATADASLVARDEAQGKLDSDNQAATDKATAAKTAYANVATAVAAASF